jgi:protein-tyrosine-phosphatase
MPTIVPATLFICYGNVARSQMAEGWYNHYTQSQRGTSAGTNPMTPHMFKHATESAITVMSEEGVDISEQQVKLATPEMINHADQIVVLCDPNLVPDYIKTNPKTTINELEDPWGQNLDFYRSTREQIRLLVQKLLATNI